MPTRRRTRPTKVVAAVIVLSALASVPMGASSEDAPLAKDRVSELEPSTYTWDELEEKVANGELAQSALDAINPLKQIPGMPVCPEPEPDPGFKTAEEAAKAIAESEAAGVPDCVVPAEHVLFGVHGPAAPHPTPVSAP